MTPPAILHDTKRIIGANAELLALFRCELVDMLDGDLLQGIIRDDMRQLVKLRMETIRERGELPARIFAFLRHDGTAFQAEVKTTRLYGETWQTEFKYLSEY